MFWDKLSNKEKIGLSFSFIFLAVAFLDRLVISPIRGRFQRIEQAIKISEKQLGHYLRNVHQKDQIAAEFEKYVKYVERSGSDEEETRKILGEIESLARQSKVYLVNMKPQTPKEVEFYKEYAIEIEAEGGIAPLTSFLYQVNVSPQLLRVERLRLNSKKKGDTVLKSSMLIKKIMVL